VYDASVGDLDECNGVKINGQYVYVVTKSFPYIGRCLKGEFEEESRPAGSSSQTAGRENQRGSGDTRPPREGPRR